MAASLSKRPRVSAPDAVETQQVAAAHEPQEVLSPQVNNVPAVTDDEKIKTEAENSGKLDKETPQCPSLQDGPYHVLGLGQRLLSALDSEFLTDVTIIVGEETIKCHSQVVSFASPKLAAILMKEKELRLLDVDPRHFRLLLQIIYTGAISHPPDVATLLDVGNLAHTMEVPVAIMFCAKRLAKRVSTGNLWTILDFANLLHNAELITTCFKTIRDATDTILQTEGFLHCTRTTLAEILEQDNLCKVSEVHLFQACVAWADAWNGDTESSTAESDRSKAQSRRAALGTTLQLIRFRLFSAEEFTEHVCPTELLSAENERDILRSIVTGKNFMPVGFSVSVMPRYRGEMIEVKFIPTGKAMSWSEFPENIRTRNRFVFSVNRNVYILEIKLKAFRMNLRDQADFEEDLIVLLLEKVVGKNILREEAHSFRGAVKNGDTFTIKFQHPHELTCHVLYALHVRYSDSESDNLTYKVYHPGVVHCCASSLQVRILDGALAPPDLSLVVADKVTT